MTGIQTYIVLGSGEEKVLFHILVPVVVGVTENSGGNLP